MSKVKEEQQPGIIPENEYKEDLEQLVRYYAAKAEAEPRFISKKKYTPNKYPTKFSDPREELEYQIEEVRRIIEGYDGLSGKGYGWLHYAKIRDPEKGKISPVFRSKQEQFFSLLEEKKRQNNTGIVGFKRRRFGFSSMQAWDAQHDSMTIPFNQIGMNSKSENDSRLLFKHVKFIHQNLPDWLRPKATVSDRRDYMEYAYWTKDSNGNKKKAGLQSWITSVAPTDTAHEGAAYSKLIIDEAGKCFSNDFLVLMADGSVKEIQNIEIGEYVMGVDSKPRLVLNKITGEDEMYEVTGKNGIRFTCNSKHEIATYHSHLGYTTLTPVEYLSFAPVKQRYYQLKRTGVEYPKNNYFFDPYWFGLWLGDGCKNSAKISNMDIEVRDYLNDEAPIQHDCGSASYFQIGSDTFEHMSLKGNLKNIRVTEHNEKYEYFRSIRQLCDYYNVDYKAYKQFVTKEDIATYKPHKDRGYRLLVQNVKSIDNVSTIPTNELRKLNVFQNKHIPECYLKTCRKDRLKLLAGIIDSDGHKDSRKDRYEVTFCLEHLAKQLQELCLSLGFSATFHTKVVKHNYKNGDTQRLHYRVGIHGNNLNEIPCRIPRKQVKVAAVKSKGRRDPMKSGFKIRPVGVGKYVGIRLEGDPLFLGHDYVIHHNCSNLLNIWAVAEDCLRLNTQRVGLPIIMGTVGDIDSDGKGLMELYKNAEAYNLDRFPIYGYHGLICDDFGNDLYTHACRWVIYEREKLKSATMKVRQTFIQKYPLEEKDAFNQVAGGGVGDIQLINEQILNLMGNPPFKKTGWMRRSASGVVDFVPDTLNGQIVIYENPQSRDNGYSATTDTVEDDDVEKTRDSSEIATTICAKAFGAEPPKLVAEFAYRPRKLDEYYEQVGMLLEWYNNTKLTIEMNKGGWRMRKYFEDHYPKLLALAPVSALSAKGGVEWKIGVKMTADRKEQMRGLIEDYVDNYVKFIPSIKLLEQFKVFGGEHATDDTAISFGWSLIMMQSDKTVVRSKEDSVKNIPRFDYQRTGKTFRLVNDGKIITPSRPTNRGRSALFKF